MKKFTIVCSSLFILLFLGMIIYVALSKDFTEPVQTVDMEEEDPDSPIWDKRMEDLVSYLAEKDLIDISSEALLAEQGLCSSALYYSGAELYWWDLENLDEESEEYKAYVSLKENGSIDMYGMGIIISPARNGPFALLSTNYEGDVKALEQAFLEFGNE